MLSMPTGRPYVLQLMHCMCFGKPGVVRDDSACVILKCLAGLVHVEPSRAHVRPCLLARRGWGGEGYSSVGAEFGVCLVQSATMHRSEREVQLSEQHGTAGQEIDYWGVVVQVCATLYPKCVQSVLPALDVSASAVAGAAESVGVL